MPDSFKLITIDGGAATGKSTTSKAVSKELKLLHVDTGSHYRTLTRILIDAGVAADAEDAVAAALADVTLETVIEGRLAFLAVNGERPEDATIRSADVNAQVSLFAQMPIVRDKLKAYQRSFVEIAESNGFQGLVMEGRDIGSVIFPDAPYRFFLSADPETRAARRAAEGQQDSIVERDKRDASRKTAPLVCPEGAVEIDTGSGTVEQVVAKIAEVVAA